MENSVETVENVRFFQSVPYCGIRWRMFEQCFILGNTAQSLCDRCVVKFSVR
ncbi:hypothetical protein RUMCAL_00056 [Ruminococcus callidus ATCC 27760]|uniref:Uncharacterized protein n=1 Tax=Ruminococcus callidus ATCC 27760 TaxID=411473 RepID=U2KZ53_9FIRM|nr:hypothetical protein RUMCAL_00056 [Ruminococcus callidus ATCC 27760]